MSFKTSVNLLKLVSYVLATDISFRPSADQIIKVPTCYKVEKYFSITFVYMIYLV
jgi:hypothetical protein